MTLPAAINATVTRCRHGQPLIVLDGSPFNGLEIRPQELRTLAQNLNALAEMAARLPTGGKRFRPTRVVIGGDGTLPTTLDVAKDRAYPPSNQG